MLSIIQGDVGGGKTIFAVREMIRRAANGVRCYCNVEVDEKRIATYVQAVYGVRYRMGTIVRLPDAEDVREWVHFIKWGTLQDPILVVLDEAQMFWNARDWATTAKEGGDMLSFLTQSRKAGVDLFIISQDENNIDKQFHRLAQFTVTARNMSHMAVPVFGIRLKGVVTYTWVENKAGNQFKLEWWVIDKRLFKCYKTESFLDSFMRGLAEGKERLQRFIPKGVSLARKIRAQLLLGDPLERIAGRAITAAWIGYLQSRRKRSRPSDSPRTVEP